MWRGDNYVGLVLLPFHVFGRLWTGNNLLTERLETVVCIHIQMYIKHYSDNLNTLIEPTVDSKHSN